MLLNIDRSSDTSVFDQLISQIVTLIDEGTIDEGFRMPSTRQLAGSLGVNRTTIVRVYEELWALGYLESNTGSYTRVRRRKEIRQAEVLTGNQEEPVAGLFESNNRCPIDRMDRYAQLMTEPLPGVVDFYHLVPDPRLIDRKMMAACFREVLADNSFNVFGYNHPRGYQPLRQVIKNHMELHSIHAADENILITNGSQSSLQLIFQSFARPGDTIAIEAPTYAMLFPLIRFYQLNVVEVSATPLGPDLEELRRQAAQGAIRFVYVTPTFQNPTGATMPQQNREELLILCEQHHIILIEDSIEEEMKYFGRVHLPIKSMDRHDHVIYLGSFSKVLAPGLRTAWVIAPADCIRKMTAVKTMIDLTSNTLSQALLYRFCRLGYYELHLRKMMRIFRRRMKTALKSLKNFMPAGLVKWDEPLGGFIIWLEILAKPPADTEEWFQNFGVRITDGSLFYFTPSEGFRIRISISKCNDSEIETGIRRIGEAIEKLYINQKNPDG